MGEAHLFLITNLNCLALSCVSHAWQQSVTYAMVSSMILIQSHIMVPNSTLKLN